MPWQNVFEPLEGADIADTAPNDGPRIVGRWQ